MASDEQRHTEATPAQGDSPWTTEPPEDPLFAVSQNEWWVFTPSHRSSFIVHRSSFIVHRSSFIVHRSSYTNKRNRRGLLAAFCTNNGGRFLQ
jgi:hypothetical protein